MEGTQLSMATHQYISPDLGAPRIAATSVAFTPYEYPHNEVARELTEFAEPGFDRFARSSGVEHRHLALPLERYPNLSGFAEANEA